MIRNLSTGAVDKSVDKRAPTPPKAATDKDRCGYGQILHSSPCAAAPARQAPSTTGTEWLNRPSPFVAGIPDPHPRRAVGFALHRAPCWRVAPQEAPSFRAGRLSIPHQKDGTLNRRRGPAVLPHPAGSRPGMMLATGKGVEPDAQQAPVVSAGRLTRQCASAPNSWRSMPRGSG